MDDLDKFAKALENSEYETENQETDNESQADAEEEKEIGDDKKEIDEVEKEKEHGEDNKQNDEEDKTNARHEKNDEPEKETSTAITPELNSTEVETTEMNSVEIETAEVETSEMNTVEIETTEMSIAEIETPEMNSVQIQEDEINASEEVKANEISSEMISNDKDMRTDKDYLWSEIRKSLFQLATDGPRHKVGQISNSNPFGANIIFRCKNGKSIAVHESIIKPHCSLFDTLSATSQMQDLYDPNGRLHISIPDVNLNILIDCLEIIYLGKTNILLNSNKNSDDIEEIKFVLDEIFKIKWDLFNDAKEKKKEKPAKEK